MLMSFVLFSILIYQYHQPSDACSTPTEFLLSKPRVWWAFGTYLLVEWANWIRCGWIWVGPSIMDICRDRRIAIDIWDSWVSYLLMCFKKLQLIWCLWRLICRTTCFIGGRLVNYYIVSTVNEWKFVKVMLTLIYQCDVIHIFLWS